MILGRPTNLWIGLVVAAVSLVSLVVMQLVPDVDSEVVVTIASAVNVFLGAVIVLVANGTPTVNEGSDVNVVTPDGSPNKTVTV